MTGVNELDDAREIAIRADRRAMDGRGSEEMSAGIFRKAAIDRLASPDDLDQVIRIAAGGGWYALAAAMLVCAAGLAWAWTGLSGSRAWTETGVNRTVHVVAHDSGVVQSVDVVVGQQVETGQRVVTIRPIGRGADVVPPAAEATTDARTAGND
jgi:hypothetical protein